MDKLANINRILQECGLPSIRSLSELCNPALCKSCGGKCCKGFPCAFSPFDFINPGYETFKAVLETGLVGIWRILDSSYREIYYLRPLSLADDGLISTKYEEVAYKQNTTCTLLDPTSGCMLPISDRPSQGLLYIAANPDCLELYPDQRLIEEWAPFAKEMKNLYYEFASARGNTVTPERIKMLQKVINK